VKTNYEPKNKGCSAFKSGVFAKNLFYRILSALGITIKNKIISKHCTTLYFGILNDNVKTNYEPENQSYSTFRNGVLLKIFLKAF